MLKDSHLALMIQEQELLLWFVERVARTGNKSDESDSSLRQHNLNSIVTWRDVIASKGKRLRALVLLL